MNGGAFINDDQMITSTLVEFVLEAVSYHLSQELEATEQGA